MCGEHQELFELLAGALDPAPYLLEAGKVIFHATGLPSRGVRVEPALLSGDKWFTSHLRNAENYATQWWHREQQDAIFSATLRRDLALAQPVREGAWNEAVKKAVLQLGEVADGIERRHLSKVLQLRFGLEHSIAGLCNPSTNENDEYFLYDINSSLLRIELVRLTKYTRAVERIPT